MLKLTNIMLDVAEAMMGMMMGMQAAMQTGSEAAADATPTIKSEDKHATCHKVQLTPSEAEALVLLLLLLFFGGAAFARRRVGQLVLISFAFA